MENQSNDFLNQIAVLSKKCSIESDGEKNELTEIINEILDAWNMTTYRYKTTRILYDYVTSESNKNNTYIIL